MQTVAVSYVENARPANQSAIVTVRNGRPAGQNDPQSSARTGGFTRRYETHLMFSILVCNGLEAYERNENFRTTPRLSLTATPTNVNFRPLLRWRRAANIIALRSLIEPFLVCLSFNKFMNLKLSSDCELLLM